MNVPFSAESMTAFWQSLVIMLEGMTGIFVFMAVFYALISLLNYFYKHQTKEEQ